MSEFDGVYIGGGNTFRLLHLLREHSLDAALKRYAFGGGAVYGGSAGAILMGSDILSCAHDDADVIGLQSTTALNFLGGHDVWCHYQPEQHAQVQAYADLHQRPVYALPARGGLVVHSGQIEFGGFEPGVTVRP
ncbi:Type 1 glutamine amidotransferase-like domain-containing protein [Deinococcus malanensis]|uniref:Type 1 glutamine amidotransferase-like domain-containing protein n=1 Tax=Deinococcus malanensis TaxID=1706855 RepID=UPI0016681929|nr:Type 1 glutamine amidotransferase-like domain-containing protein [Deinococcus malanensis]